MREIILKIILIAKINIEKKNIGNQKDIEIIIIIVDQGVEVEVEVKIIIKI